MLGIPTIMFRARLHRQGSQNNIWDPFIAFNDIFVNTNPTRGPFIAFSGIFVNTNPIRGPFVAFSGIFVNTNPTMGHKKNLFSHLLYKRGRGTFFWPMTHLALSLIPPSLSHFVGLNQHQFNNDRKFNYCGMYNINWCINNTCKI